MESRDFIRPMLAGLVGIGLIVLVIVLVIKAFSGGGSSAPSSQLDITKYADTPNASVTLLVDGPTDIDQDHRQLKLVVSSTGNEIDAIQGYQGDVTASQTYPNNSVGFATFLQTLKLMDFSKGKTSNINYSGYCPTGERYTFTFYNGQTPAFTYWRTSCGQGTYEGELAPVLQQFRLQIPSTDFGKVAGNIPLGF